MNKRAGIIAILGMVLWAFTAVPGQGEEGSEGMPPMGPPEEITSLAHMVGTWDAALESRMSPDSPFVPMTGVAEFSYILEGACLKMDYRSQFMGMDFVGVSFTTFDRETGKWTEAWIDNMGARMSVYTGGMKNGKKVLEGTDHMFGQVWLSRSTTYNVTPERFEWMMEHSTDGGETWATYMTATYTKRP